MNCPNCNTYNDIGASYCKNCGTQLPIIPTNSANASLEASHTINILLILMSVESFFLLFWFVLQKIVVPAVYKNDWSHISTVYKYGNWVINGIFILAYLISSITVQNNRVRIFFLVFLLVRILVLIGYQINI